MVECYISTALVAGPDSAGRDCVIERLHARGLTVAFSYDGADQASIEHAHALRDRLRDARARAPRRVGRKSDANGALPVPGSLTRTADVQAMAMAVRETVGQLDALVTFTPPARHVPLLSVTEETWTEEFHNPVKGLWVAARAVVPGMIDKGGGRIVHILSSACQEPEAQLAPHCASQGAGHMFTRALAEECRPYHIAVNAVATPFLLPAPGSNGHPLPRDPHLERAGWRTVAATVEYLLLAVGEATTGQTIVLGGNT